MTTTHIYCLLFTGYQTLDLMGPVELLSRLPAVQLHFVSHSGGLMKGGPRKWFARITVSIGEPLPPETDAETLKEKTLALLAGQKGRG